MQTILLMLLRVVLGVLGAWMSGFVTKLIAARAVDPGLFAAVNAAVTKAEGQAGLNGPQKRAAAFAEIQSYVKDLGLDVGTSLINGLLELACNSLPDKSTGTA